MNFGLAIIFFFTGFIIINGLKALHFRKNRMSILKTQKTNFTENKINEQAFIKLLPYTPVYYLTVWLWCGIFYFANHTTQFLFYDGIATGVMWIVLSLIFETIIWVLIKHQMSISMKLMYVKSQPWMLLNYYIILVSPLMIAFSKM